MATPRALHLLIPALLLLLAPPARAQSQRPADAPLSLTASDGSGLELTALSAQVVVEEPLAFTELHLTFRNPEDRVREGRFRITLPPGAVVSRFAMKIDGRFQEGEVVELAAARRAYEDFLHRRQDPALLESEAGNEFSARVFPIPARASKELIVSYSQELARRDTPYRLPLVGLPRLGTLAIRAQVSKLDAAGATSSLGGRRARTEVIEVEKRDHLPDRDFELPLAAGDARLGLRHDNLVVARVRPLTGNLPPDPVTALTVLFDTSASRALGYREQITRLQELLTALRQAGDPTVKVVAFDQTIEVVHDGRASGFGEAARRRLADRRALGASNLENALAWLAGQKGQKRVLLVSDAVATAGELENGKLAERVRALGQSGIERLDVLAVGGIRDDERAARLVAAGLTRAGVVLDATAPVAEQARRLGLATRSGLAVSIPGASWVWPQRLDGIQPGDEVLIYADLPAGRPFKLNIGGADIATGAPLASAPGPLLERAWVKARIARVLAQRDAALASDADLAEALRKQVIDLSVKHRVLSPYTALLVLETERDYQRFGIERRALADILTVGPSGVTVLARRDVVTAPARAPTDEEVRGPDQPFLRQLRPRGERDQNERKEEAAAATSRPGPAARPSVAAAPAPAPAAPPPAFPPPAAAPMLESAGDAREAAKSGAPARATRRPPHWPPPGIRPIMPPQPERTSGPAYEGPFAEVMALLAKGKRQEAFTKALAWHTGSPGDVLALVALGEAAEALGDGALAARVYGSFIDLFPGRADLRRFAGNRLERLAGKPTLVLAADTYRKAADQRPDHPASHRLLAFALLKLGRPAEAFAVLAGALKQRYPEGRFAGVDRILAEDLGLAAAAWMRAEPARAADIRARLEQAGGRAENQPSLRFVLTWETDANDVDFHIRDGQGGHAFYSQRQLASGGELYADVTTGYGPECFTVRGPAAGRAFPYQLQAHYYRRGPMGYGMGKLEVIDHDGRGTLRFEQRPFLVMRDNAYVELGKVAGSPNVADLRNAR